jgi:soluble lytic murein transglycosylase-like protein
MTVTRLISLSLCLVGIAVGSLGMTQGHYYSTKTDELSKELDFAEAKLESISTRLVKEDTENNLFLKILILRPGISPLLAKSIAKSVYARAAEHGKDPDLVLSIIDVESNFQPKAISYAGAVGLMQIMPFWVKELGIDKPLTDPDTSIHYGLEILGLYEKNYETIELALTVYNKGPYLVNGDLKAGRDPFNGYSSKIMDTYKRLKDLRRA